MDLENLKLEKLELNENMEITIQQRVNAIFRAIFLKFVIKKQIKVRLKTRKTQK